MLVYTYRFPSHFVGQMPQIWVHVLTQVEALNHTYIFKV